MMRDVISRSVVLLALAASACGGDNIHPPDAFVKMDAPPDSPPPACDYTEQHDLTNDYNLTTGFMAEQTGIAFSGTSKTICGTVNNGHFSTSNFSVDIDDYAFTVAADADVLVTLTGQNLQNIATVGIFSVESGTMNATGGGYFYSDHAVFSAHLKAGSYEISVEAYANADIPASVPYKLKIASDNPLTRCPKITAAANYTEANDGTTNDANDTVAVDYSMAKPYSATSPATTPESTGLTLTAGTNYRISGTSAMRAQVGSYFDKDTYLVTTGPTTNQLAIRVNWPSTTTDLDLLVFKQGSYFAAATAAKMMLGEDEFVTFATDPNAAYWIWVGAYSDSTVPSGGATYDLSLCAEMFTP